MNNKSGSRDEEIEEFSPVFRRKRRCYRPAARGLEVESSGLQLLDDLKEDYTYQCCEQRSLRENQTVKKVGLVADVTRVLEKHKSEITSWHRLNNESSVNADVLKFRIVSLKKEFKHAICICENLLVNESAENFDDGNVGKNVEQNLIVLCDINVVEKGSIGVNSEIVVHPPYQKLINKNIPYPVIVGPKFVLRSRK